MNRKSHFLLLLPALAILLFCNACVSLSSMQSARIVPKKSIEMGLNAIGISSPSVLGDDFFVSSIIKGGEVWGRYGIGKKVDLGLKTSVGAATGLTLDTKWQFLGDQESFFAMATGLGIGVSFVNPLSFVESGFVYSLHLPLYTSIHPTEKLAVYLNPKVILSKFGNNVANNYYGGSLGAFYGEKIKIGLETSVFHQQVMIDEGEGLLLIQGGLGIKISF